MNNKEEYFNADSPWIAYQPPYNDYEKSLSFLHQQKNIAVIIGWYESEYTYVIKIMAKKEPFEDNLISDLNKRFPHEENYYLRNTFAKDDIIFYTTDKFKIEDFLEIIDPYVPLISLRTPIFKFMNLTSQQEHADNISKLVEQERFDEAIEQAKSLQDEGYKEVIWELAQVIHTAEHQDINIAKKINLYKSISENNPHYAEANEQLYNLYKENPNSLPSEIMQAAIKSKQQTLVDQTFHTMCGYKGLQPQITNIQGDVATLISMAEHIKSLNHIINKQNKEIEQFKSSSASSAYKPNLF